MFLQGKRNHLIIASKIKWRNDFPLRDYCKLAVG